MELTAEMGRQTLIKSYKYKIKSGTNALKEMQINVITAGFALVRRTKNFPRKRYLR